MKNVLKWYGVFYDVASALEWANSQQGTVLHFQLISQSDGYIIVILLQVKDE